MRAGPQKRLNAKKKKKKKKKVAAAMEVLLSQSEVRQVARRVIHSPELGEGQLEN